MEETIGSSLRGHVVKDKQILKNKYNLLLAKRSENLNRIGQFYRLSLAEKKEIVNIFRNCHRVASIKTFIL